MRIIGGKAKGKKILIPINKKTRPLKDIVKESIFNILKHSNLLKLILSTIHISETLTRALLPSPTRQKGS